MLSVKETFIALTSTGLLKKSDIIVLLEGDGFFRINHAVDLLQQGWASKILISGGSDNPGYGSFHCTAMRDKLLAMGIQESQIILEDQSQNTKEQAHEVINYCIQNNFKSIILVASHFHQFRAFLTFLMELIKINQHHNIHIMNSPSRELSRFEENPRGRRIDLLQSEFEKIVQYGENNDIASYEDAIEYYKNRKI